MNIFMKLSIICMLFTLSTGVLQAQNITTLPNNYTLSVDVESDHDSFTNFTGSLLRSGKATPLLYKEVYRYSSIFFNRPKDILWASCAEGYKLTKATSKSDTRIIHDPVIGAGIVFSERRSHKTYNLTIFCSTKASISQDWITFWNAFRDAVRKRNRSALRSMMSTDFEWAGDGNVGPEEAIGNLDQGIVSWGSVLKSINGRVINCKFKDSTCWNFSGRKAKRTVGPEWLVFELGTDGRWKWARLVGD